MKFCMSLLDTAIEFGKRRLDSLLGFWEELDDDKKKVFIGCAIATVAVVCVASVAYSIGKAVGEKEALDEDF